LAFTEKPIFQYWHYFYAECVFHYFITMQAISKYSYRTIHLFGGGAMPVFPITVFAKQPSLVREMLR